MGLENKDWSNLGLLIDINFNLAILYLEEINNYNWHDNFERDDDYEIIRFIDQNIHPTYLRLIEGVLKPLCSIIAFFSRIDRGKSTDGLNLFSVIQEIDQQTSLYEIVRPYKRIIRNAIAHGGVAYLQNEIRYHDDRGNEEKYSDSEIIRIFDDLLDTCNALALATSIFLLSHQSFQYKLPQQILIEELKIETKLPWWEIIGCTPSGFDNLNQLLIYARPKTSDYGKVLMSAFQSAILAERFAPGYDRYFFSIRSKKTLPGWAGFDGKKMNEIRKKKITTIEAYQGVMGNDILFYIPKVKLPRFLTRIETYCYSLRLQWPIFIDELRQHFNCPEICVRNSKIHRNSWGIVLNANVYIKPNSKNKVTRDIIYKYKGKIVRQAFIHARKQLFWLNILRLLPLGYARISVYSKDYRRRHLSSYGLGKHLVCTIQIQKIKRIQTVDIFGSTIEQNKGYRIAWNRAWLES